MMQYLSAEYFDELVRRLNADADWGNMAAALNAKVTLTVTDRATSMMLAITDGVVTAEKVTGEDPADFKFEAPYDVWARIVRGQTDFNTAVLTGKMRFKGSLPRIMAIQPQISRLTQVAKDIGAQP